MGGDGSCDSGSPGSPRSKNDDSLGKSPDRSVEGAEEGKAYDSDWNSQVGADNSVEFENSFMGEDIFTSTYEGITADVKQVGVAKNKRSKNQKVDTVELNATVSCEVDQISIEIAVTSGSKTEFKGNSAVQVGEKFTV